MPNRLALLLVVIGTACVGRQQEPAQLEPDVAVETFDAAWRIVYETHFDTTFNGVDWLALKQELRPQAEAARNVQQLRAVMTEMLGRLEQSHFSLIPAEAADDGGGSEAGDQGDAAGDAGMDVRLIEDQVVVSRVDSGGPAESAGMKPGWVIVAVGEDLVEDLIQSARDAPAQRSLGVRVWQRVMARLGGQRGDQKSLAVLDGNDIMRTIDLTLGPQTGLPVKFGNLPTFFARFASREVKSEDVTVGVIWFNNWMVPLVARVDDAMDHFRELDGIVIDLRGNTGGVGAMVMGVAGHFYDTRTTLGTMKTRRNELRFFANPRRTGTSGQPVEPYDGPVAIVQDEMSASASEMFVGGMQMTGRVRVFGERSMGAVLPAAAERLPNGDILYHAFGEFTTTTGVRLEGRGVVPDEAVRLTRADLLSGADSPLVAALRWIAEQRSSGSLRPETGKPRRME
jgi:carboxyl-terminal processing protease